MPRTSDPDNFRRVYLLCDANIADTIRPRFHVRNITAAEFAPLSAKLGDVKAHPVKTALAVLDELLIGWGNVTLRGKPVEAGADLQSFLHETEIVELAWTTIIGVEVSLMPVRQYIPDKTPRMSSN